MLNVAVTDFAALIATLQVLPLEVSQPVQATEAPLPGVAVRTTAVPELNEAVHPVVAHAVMPAGLLVTVPEAAPALFTVSTY